MAAAPLQVAWISDYPIEWMEDLPEALRHLPRQHPATWAMVLLGEFQKDPSLRIHVIVLRRHIERDLSFERHGTMFHVLKAPGMLRVASLFWVDTLLIRKLLRRLRPDLVHAWGIERGAGLTASRLRYPYVVTIQGLLSWYKEIAPATHPYERLVTMLEPVSLRRARIVTTESAFAVNYLRQRYPRLRVHQAEHAPNWSFHQARRAPQSKPVRLLSVGTLGYRKGSDVLLGALNELGKELDFEAALVMSVPQQAYLDQFRATTSPQLWERLQVRTRLLPPEVAQEMARATLLVLPTRADTSPNAVKEAAVTGLPVVASKVGGIPDYVFHGRNGLLFEPTDVAACAGALRAACAHPLFGRGLVETEALEKVRAYLSPRRMAEKFLEAYQLALQDHAQGP